MLNTTIFVVHLNPGLERVGTGDRRQVVFRLKVFDGVISRGELHHCGSEAELV